VQHLTLAASDADASAKLHVTLWPGDEAFPVSPALPHADDVREALRASWPAAQQCYASALVQHPDAGGRMELRFLVDADGDAAEVAEEGDTRFADVETTRCVLGLYRGLRLPVRRIAGARETRFGYVLHFEAAPP
jgi:hypothetical protein